MPRDVAGISRPGAFERIPLPDADGRVTHEADTHVAPRSGTAVSVNYRAQGARATSTPDFKGANVRDPYTLDYQAQEQGAVTPRFADVWPAPVRATRSGRS